MLGWSPTQCCQSTEGLLELFCSSPPLLRSAQLSHTPCCMHAAHSVWRSTCFAGSRSSSQGGAKLVSSGA